jgi:hypothetical protein
LHDLAECRLVFGASAVPRRAFIDPPTKLFHPVVLDRVLAGNRGHRSFPQT